jgi:hypothetical protein
LKKFLITAALIAMASPTYAITRNADGLPESTRTCRSLMHVEDDHDSAENHFAVGDVDTDGGSCVQYDNSPIANAILKKCPMGTYCEFRARIVGMAGPFVEEIKATIMKTGEKR